MQTPLNQWQLYGVVLRNLFIQILLRNRIFLKTDLDKVVLNFRFFAFRGFLSVLGSYSMIKLSRHSRYPKRCFRRLASECTTFRHRKVPGHSSRSRQRGAFNFTKLMAVSNKWERQRQETYNEPRE